MAKDEKSVREKLNEFLHEKNYFTDGLAFVEGKTGVNRLYLFAGCAGLLALYLIVGYASSFVVSLLGFLYPAYASVKAVESDRKDDDTQWLTYWVVYAAFGIVEFFSDIFLSWFPLYFLFKCAFLAWCMAPFSWNGSVFIYQRFIAPFVMKHEKTVDEVMHKAGAVVGDLANKAEKQVKQVAMDALQKKVNEDGVKKSE